MLLHYSKKFSKSLLFNRMVKYDLLLSDVFACLADDTRRNILQRVAYRELSVTEISSRYPMSMAAVSKHLALLEAAGLVNKRRVGKQHLISINPLAFINLADYFRQFDAVWNDFSAAQPDKSDEQASPAS
jgi:DNA-binding transcriptional ArsR family regulator